MSRIVSNTVRDSRIVQPSGPDRSQTEPSFIAGLRDRIALAGSYFLFSVVATKPLRERFEAVAKDGLRSQNLYDLGGTELVDPLAGLKD